MVAGAGLSVSAADLLGFSPPSPAEDGPEIENISGKRQLRRGKCLVDVKGQRSDWAGWLETVAGSSKSANQWLQANSISKREKSPTSHFIR